MVLASNSPQRKALIKYITKDVDFLAVETDEAFLEELDIYENVKNVAKNKALAVIEKFGIKNDVVVGVDTIVSSVGEILLKPNSYDEAYRMIESYNNNDTEIISGVCIAVVGDGEVNTKTYFESSFVKFSDVTDEKIKLWLAQDDYLGCSGAIKIEKVQNIFETKITGSISNIIGLPLESLSKELNLLDKKYSVCDGTGISL